MEPVTIIICDDDKTLQKFLQKEIENFFSVKDFPCKIICCCSGEELLKLPAPDFLLLDIQMAGRNGMEIARELRKNHQDIILIFVTALSEYVYEAFDVNAFHYLVKPFSNDKLQEVLNKALQQYTRQVKPAVHASKIPFQNIPSQDTIQNETRGILVKRGGLSTRVLFSDIYYAEVFNRKVMLHTKNGNIEYYGKLTDLAQQAGADFYRTHRAYLVNLKYVEKYDASTIWLEQGTALLSKKQFSGFVKQYMQYINRYKGKNEE